MGVRRMGIRLSAHARCQTERASRSACFFTALGSAAVKSLVLMPLPPSGSTSLSRACTSTLMVLMYSLKCARKRAACFGVGYNRTCTVVFNSLTVASRLGWPVAVLLDELLDELLADVACCAQEERARPQ